MLIASPAVVIPTRVEAVQPSYLEVTTPIATVQTPDPVPLTIEEKIRAKAREYGYSENRAVAIAKAESGLDPKAKNKNSTASGIFQFIRSTWVENCKGDVFNEDDNINCATRMLSEGGENNWLESKAGWGYVK